MRAPEEPALPLLEPAQELLGLAADALVGLAGVQPDLAGAGDEGGAQDLAELALVEEVEHAGADAVEVGALVAEGDGAGVGLQGGDDGVGERGGQVEGQGRRVRGRGGEGEELGQPEGQEEGRARLEALGRVVEVAEVGAVDFELAGDFL